MKIVLGTDGLGFNLTVPVIVAKGAFEGPVLGIPLRHSTYAPALIANLGITSAVHGNELNGIPLIFRLLRELDVETLNGTVAAVSECPHLKYSDTGAKASRSGARFKLPRPTDASKEFP